MTEPYASFPYAPYVKGSFHYLTDGFSIYHGNDLTVNKSSNCDGYISENSNGEIVVGYLDNNFVDNYLNVYDAGEFKYSIYIPSFDGGFTIHNDRLYHTDNSGYIKSFDVDFTSKTTSNQTSYTYDQNNLYPDKLSGFEGTDKILRFYSDDTKLYGWCGDDKYYESVDGINWTKLSISGWFIKNSEKLYFYSGNDVFLVENGTFTNHCSKPDGLKLKFVNGNTLVCVEASENSSTTPDYVYYSKDKGATWKKFAFTLKQEPYPDYYNYVDEAWVNDNYLFVYGGGYSRIAYVSLSEIQ